MKNIIGLSLGASTIKLVQATIDKNNKIEIEQLGNFPHLGNPKQVLTEKIKKLNPEKIPIVATGRKFKNLLKIHNISEAEATENAYLYLKHKYPNVQSIASLGAESFITYTLDKTGHIINVNTKNQCASGTGEFYLQQIHRMDLSLDEAINISHNCTPHRVSGRCSVFAKSDCTHALNKGIPKCEVTAGLSLMISDKIGELLHKENEGRKLLVGGLTRNKSVIDFIYKQFDVIIPDEADYFEALGAAIYGLHNQIEYDLDYDDLFIPKQSSFAFLESLDNFRNLVDFKQDAIEIKELSNEFILGLDVGSTTTKAVLIDKNSKAKIASIYLYTHGDPIKAAKKCYQAILDKMPKNGKIIGLGTTGSGRHIAGLHAQTPAIYNEIIAHATAAVHFDPEVDTIFEIGGQDAKYTYIVNKVPADYAMNEACSAGTGSFIEESAYETLGLKVNEIQELALNADNPPNFSDQCAAFISSDIKTALQEGISKENIVAGLTYSICLNYINRVKGNRQVGKKILMQGGVCYNQAIPIAMAAITKTKIIVPPEPGLMGAFGVALETLEKMNLGLLKEQEFNLKDLINREVVYLPSFICKGGKEKCDLGCEINMVKVEGKKYPFGGACNKYYNIVQNKKVDTLNYDLVKIREAILFDKYTYKKEIPENAKSIGINYSFLTHSLYPLYHNFFSAIGYKVILSDEFDERGYQRENTSFCFPAQLSLGLFQNLLDKNPDYYFIPNIYEMYGHKTEEDRLDFNSTCVFVQGEALFLKQAFKDYRLDGKLLTPKLNFAKGYRSQLHQFIEIASQIGFYDVEKVKEAYFAAIEQLEAAQEELILEGTKVLEKLKQNKDEFGIVILGRVYNSFNDIANKGIPQKIASRGIYVIPFDMLDYTKEDFPDSMYWEGGKRILKSANLVKKEHQLFPVYISNFSCGPDSLIITTFREMMGTKPSLTLELDSHSADAGINTRLDAFIDIVNNYRQNQNSIKQKDNFEFKICELKNAKVAFIETPDGKQIPLNDENVVLLIPSMGDLAAPLFAASLRSLGFNAIALPEADNETLRLGRSVATGKECLPLLILAGSLMQWIQNHWDGKKYVAFFNVQGAGNCRLGQYPVFLRHLIRRMKWDKVAQMTLMNEDGFAGFGEDFAIRGIQAIMASDVLDDVRSGILTISKNPQKGIEFFNTQFEELVNIMANQPKLFIEALKVFSERINEQVERKSAIENAKYIGLMGEIFARRDGFSHKWLHKFFAERGFVTKISYISEWIFYVDYLIDKKLLEPEESFKNKVERRIRHSFMTRLEKKIKKIFVKSGFYKYEPNQIKRIMQNSTHIIPLDYKGEPGIVLGATLTHGLTDYAGIVNLGPFGCMPTRITEAITLPEINVESKIKAMMNTEPNIQMSSMWNGDYRIPFLTIETDGNVYPQIIEAKLEAFVLQAQRAAKLMELEKAPKENSTHKIFSKIN